MRIRFYICEPRSEWRQFIFHALLYCSGVLALSFLTLGQFNPAPLSTINERNPGKKWWNDWTIWIHHPEGYRLLRAEVICAVGFLIWSAAAFAFCHYKETAS